MDIKVYDRLPDDAVEIRTQVFVDEQGFSKDLEFDDNETRATHVVGYIDKSKAATARFYFEQEKKAYLIGRIAVVKSMRGKRLGAKIVTACEELIKQQGGTNTVIHAQVQAQGFYENLGYSADGEIDLEEGVEHIWMKKHLN